MKVVITGDSITEGMNTERYFPNEGIVNKGLYGDNCEGLYARLEQDVISEKPDLLFVLIGINDFALGRTNAAILASYYKIMKMLNNALPNAHVYIASLLPTRNIENRPNERINDLNRHLQELMVECLCNYLPLADIFKDAQGMLKEEATTDGLHLSEAGYALWAEKMGEYIDFVKSKSSKIQKQG